MKLFKNTKAQTSTKQWLVGLVLMGILIIVVLSFIGRSGSSTKKVMKKHVESLTNDYDNDGIPDFSDESPCVTGQDTIIDDEGITQFYYADEPSSGTCPSPSELSVDVNTGKRVCILPVQICANRLEKAYKDIQCIEETGKPCDS